MPVRSVYESADKEVVALMSTYVLLSAMMNSLAPELPLEQMTTNTAAANTDAYSHHQ